VSWSSQTYNPASQLTATNLNNTAYVKTPTNRVQSLAYDGLNRDTAVAGVSDGYDGRQNQTRSTDGGRTFTYDQENRLTGSSTAGVAAIGLAYDPLGRLYTTTVGATTTTFLYDGDQLVGEYQGATLKRRYVHGMGEDDPLVWYEIVSGTPTRNWLYADRQGTIIAIGSDAGAGTAQYAYGPYGDPDTWTGSRFRYTGQIVLPEAQLYYYKARVYDPNSARFLQTDPVGYGADMDLYAYVADLLDTLLKLFP
jgi:RHS repeat-associated protein